MPKTSALLLLAAVFCACGDPSAPVQPAEPGATSSQADPSPAPTTEDDATSNSSPSTTSPSTDPWCTDGDLVFKACGNCGQQVGLCEDGQVIAYGPCEDEGECAPGTVEAGACGSDVGECVLGTYEHTCTVACRWDEWTECVGQVDPVVEACGDKLDQDCDGLVDNRCVCTEVAAGAAGAFAVTGTVVELVSSPIGCVVYGYTNTTSPELIVFDVMAKAELTRVALPAFITDLDLSPSGLQLVAAHGLDNLVSVIDPASFTAMTLPTTGGPWAIEVGDAGLGIYVEEANFADYYVVDLALRQDAFTFTDNHEPDLELDPTGTILYIGESGLSSSEAIAYAWSGTTLTAGPSTDFGEFAYPVRSIVASPGGQHVYFGESQLDATELSFITGTIGEGIFTEDYAGTFAVGESQLFDAETLLPAAAHGVDATAAALVANDREVWLYSPTTGDIAYSNVDDLLGGYELGNRHPPPGPLSEYTIDALVHDPVQPQLYALDVAGHAVLFIDAATLTVTHHIVVGSAPTDLAVDPSGAGLYVGHAETSAVAHLDIATGTFVAWFKTADMPYEVAALDGFVAVIDEDQFTTLRLLDLAGVQVDYVFGVYQGALAATGDGSALFLAESDSSISQLTRYGLLPHALVKVDSTSASFPPRSIVPLLDGTGLYWDSTGRFLEGSNLAEELYSLGAQAIAVTADGRLVTTETDVFDVATGSNLGALPFSATVQASDLTGTVLYAVDGDGLIQSVDLTVY